MTMMVKFWGGIGNNGQSAGTGNWSTASNWLPNQVPGIGDLAIDQGGHIVATNISIDDMTVWLDGNASVPVELSLDGSSIGPATDLIANATTVPSTIELQNSPLEGSIFAGSGQTQMTVDPNSSAVNYGWICVANTIAPTGITLVANGSFGNEGFVEVGTNGSFTLAYGAGPGGMQNVWNTGDLRADPGGRVWLDADRATRPPTRTSPARS